jgi:hypothetical protein
MCEHPIEDAHGQVIPRCLHDIRVDLHSSMCRSTGLFRFQGSETSHAGFSSPPEHVCGRIWLGQRQICSTTV